MFSIIKRIEDQGTVTIVYKYYPFIYILLIAVVVLSSMDDIERKWKSLLEGVILTMLVAHIIVYWKPNREISKKMKEGGVEMSGSKLSFKHPMTFKFKK